MRVIFEYAVNMLPYMMLTVPVYGVVRFFLLKKQSRQTNWYREIALFLFVLFVVGLASQTIIPKFEFGVNGFGIVKNGVHSTNLIPFKVFVDTYTKVFVDGYLHYFLINFLGNIILFMPFGFVIPTLWNVPSGKVIAIGFSCSLLIELCQLFLARGTDVDDLLLNTAGVCLGLLVYRGVCKLWKAFPAIFRYRFENKSIRKDTLS